MPADKITHWTAADGITCRIQEMEDTHLFNALAFVVRRKTQAKELELYRLAESFDKYIEALHEECERREPRKLARGALALPEKDVRELDAGVLKMFKGGK